MEYITNTFQGFAFGYDYHQVFANKWMSNLLSEELIKMVNANVITDEDVSIVKFLYTFHFATAAIIADYLGNGDTLEVVQGKLDRLVKNRVLNKFMLSRTREEKPFTDALMIYCMDLGGKIILSHYGTPNMGIENWYTSNNMMSSEMVASDLATANFYVQVYKNVGSRLRYFVSCPQYRISKSLVVPSFELSIEQNGQNKYFVGEIARNYDFPVGFREKAIKIESILNTKAWMKYFTDTGGLPPSLLIVAENDAIALEAGRILSAGTAITSFRLTTDARILAPMGSSGVFMKYSPDEDNLIGVRSSTFAGQGNT